MTMSHKDALRAAQEAVRERAASMSQFLSKEDFYDEQDTILLRAYLDARGLVMVPKKADIGMIGAWYRYKNGHRFAGEEPARDTSDVGAYRAMLAAAPDPFGGE